MFTASRRSLWALSVGVVALGLIFAGSRFHAMQAKPPDFSKAAVNGMAALAPEAHSDIVAVDPEMASSRGTQTASVSRGAPAAAGPRAAQPQKPSDEEVVDSEPIEADEALEPIEIPVSDFPSTPIGRHLQSHMLIIDGIGPEAEANYQASLDALREDAEQASALLYDAYAHMSEERYLDRWKAVDTLSAIHHHGALAALSVIASEPIPEERYPGEHGLSSRSEETMIRAAAIRGIATLAARGITEAEQELANLVNAPDRLVREHAVIAYLNTGADRQQRIHELRTTLDPQDHWMLKLQTLTDVRLMPQPSTADERPDDASHRKASSATSEAPTSPPTGVSQ